MSIIFLQNTPGFLSFEKFSSRMKPAGGHLRDYCPLSEEARAQSEARRAGKDR